MECCSLSYPVQKDVHVTLGTNYGALEMLVSLCSYRLAHLNLRNLYLMWILAESDSKQQSSHSLIGVLRTSEGHSCL